MKSIVVIGGGFAGLWSAIGAARKRHELGLGPDEVSLTLVSRDGYLGVRPRFYEPDLSEVRVPLDPVLGAIGVARLEGEVTDIDAAAGRIDFAADAGPESLAYDRLVLATGSRLDAPDIPGVTNHAFSVDTYDAAQRLDHHIKALPGCAESPGRATAVVIGAGLTGIEAACELPGRLGAVLGGGDGAQRPRVVLVDSAPVVGSDMGASARPVIEEALAELGIEPRMGVEVALLDEQGVVLGGGERIEARTVILSTGLRASPLTELVPAERDHKGRLAVDRHLKVAGLDEVFAAGDVARAMIDEDHATVMSCQHALPTGRLAGHNVVADLVGEEMLALEIGYYVTCLDLGPWGALFTNGWEREVVAKGAAAKETKRRINCQRIYPPSSGDRADFFAAAAPAARGAPR
jgi:NADH dehydrogenase